jgi:chemotaxis protein MotB
MSRKKKHEHVNHERWLVSYADFITLLFAFFVVLFSAGQADKKKQARMASSIQQAFSQNGIFDVHTKLPPLTDAPGSTPSDAAAPLAIPMEDGQAEMVRVKQRLASAAAREIANGMIAIHEGRDGLTISLNEAGFFDSGSAEVRPEALEVLDRIASALPAAGLRVEGHTDNVPIATMQYASNWELSSARASSIARLLLRNGNVKPDRLSVAGYAEFHPLADNSTAEGRSKNRRVDLVVETGEKINADDTDKWDEQVL